MSTLCEHSSNGSEMASTTRRAIRSISATDSISGKNIVNSSPARRASNGRLRALPVNSALTTTRRRLATMISSWSPRAWPRLSLTILKRSRSTNSIAEFVPRRRFAQQLVGFGAEMEAVGQRGDRDRTCRAHGRSRSRRGLRRTGCRPRPQAWAWCGCTEGGAGETRSPSSTASKRSLSADSARALSLLGRSEAT